MGSSKKTTTNQASTSTVAPPTFTAPGLTDVANQVTHAAAGLSAIPAYSGPFVATADPTAAKGVTDAYAHTADLAGTMSNYAQGQLPALTATPTFNSSLPTATYQAANPVDLTNVINASIAPVMQHLTEQVLPGIKSDALASGAYSGDRAMLISPELALRDASGQASNIAATLGYQGYQAAEDRRLQGFEADQNRALEGYNADTSRTLGTGNLMTERMAQLPGLLNTIMQMSGSQGDLLRMASDYNTANAQGTINNNLAADQYATSRPFAGLDIASNLLAQLSGRYGTTDSSMKGTTTESTGGLGSVLQGAMGLAGMVAGFPGVSSMLGLGGSAATPLASSIFKNTQGSLGLGG